MRSYLLLEVSSVLLVNKDKIEVISDAELLVDFSESWRQIESTEEQTDRDCLSYKVTIE